MDGREGTLQSSTNCRTNQPGLSHFLENSCSPELEFSYLRVPGSKFSLLAGGATTADSIGMELAGEVLFDIGQALSTGRAAAIQTFVPVQQCPNLIGLIFGDQTIHALVFLFRKHAGCGCSTAITFGLHLLDDCCAITDQDIRSSVGIGEMGGRCMEVGACFCRCTVELEDFEELQGPTLKDGRINLGVGLQDLAQLFAVAEDAHGGFGQGSYSFRGRDGRQQSTELITKQAAIVFRHDHPPT